MKGYKNSIKAMNKIAKLLPNNTPTPQVVHGCLEGGLVGGKRRSSSNGNIVTVFGSSGFLGRYVVNNLGNCVLF